MTIADERPRPFDTWRDMETASDRFRACGRALRFAEGAAAVKDAVAARELARVELADAAVAHVEAVRAENRAPATAGAAR